MQGGEDLGCQFRAKGKVRFSCASRLLLLQHQWRTLLTGCVCRGKTPHPRTGSREIQLCCPTKASVVRWEEELEGCVASRCV